MLDKYDLAQKEVDYAEKHGFIVYQDFKQDLEKAKKEKKK